jgi:hypothetical protein
LSRAVLAGSAGINELRLFNVHVSHSLDELWHALDPVAVQDVAAERIAYDECAAGAEDPNDLPKESCSVRHLDLMEREAAHYESELSRLEREPRPITLPLPSQSVSSC